MKLCWRAHIYKAMRSNPTCTARDTQRELKRRIRKRKIEKEDKEMGKQMKTLLVIMWHTTINPDDRHKFKVNLDFVLSSRQTWAAE